MAPEQILHYRIERKLGEGGMGAVFLATDTKLNRKVAIKILSPDKATDPESRQRFIHEAKAEAMLNHPNIVTFYEVGEAEGQAFIVMEYVEGQTLSEFVQSEKLSLNQILDLMTQVGEGLQAAHEKGVVHRDIKPDNIMVTPRGKVKITDFGLARWKGATTITKTGTRMGTAFYMSPEQAEGRKLDHRSDIFSLGVILYELLCQQRPFTGDSEAVVLYEILNTQPQPLARFRRGVSEDLERIVTKCLSKDLAERYQSAADLVADLKHARRTSESVGAVSGHPHRKLSSPLTTAFAALSILVVAIVGYFLITRTPLSQKLGLSSSAETRWTNSIAVLPLRDFSPNKDQEYFCDGMTDALIGKLSGIEGLKVISMTSVMRYKTSDHDLKKIGQDLQVNTILEGSIQFEGDRMRLQAQLINVSDDSHLWSQTYNRELKSVFDIQDEISRAIVDAMKIELLGEDTTIITRRQTENVEAYDFYIRGRHLWSKRTDGDLTKSIAYFEKAIELDSNYALAYSGLADAWAILPVYSDALESETLPKARKAAERSLKIDPHLAEAHASSGLILRNESDLQGAEREFKRSIELNPGYHWAHYWYSKVLSRLGRFREQTEQENLAFELNPMSIALVSNRADRKKATFEFQEAENMYQRLIEIEPNRWTSYVGYADLLAMNDRKEEALKQCSLAVRISDQAYNDVAYIYDRVGDFEAALWAANKYIEFEPDNPNSYDTRGYIYALYGHLDSAIASYKKALELNPDFASSIGQLGAMYLFRREYEKAESLYQALASHPNKYTRAWGRDRLTTIPAHQGKFKEAFRMVDELEALEISDSLPISSQVESHFTKAIYYIKLNLGVELARAELEYIVDKLMETEANNSLIVDAGGSIAVCYARMGDFETANRLMREQGKVLDNYEYVAASAYWISYGTLEALKGNYDLSSIYLERAARTLNGWLIWLKYAKIRLEAGRPHEAIEIFERLIDRYDRHRSSWAGLSVTIHYELGKAYEEANRPVDASAQYGIFLDIWKNADPGLESVEDARERLARLNDESSG